MPDRYGDSDEDVFPSIEAEADVVRRQRLHLSSVPASRLSKEDREAARRSRIEAQQSAAAFRAAGIERCGLCDEDGYTSTGFVCDHVDRRKTYARGRDLVRATMGWKNPTSPTTSGVRQSQRPSQRRTGCGEPNPTRTAAGSSQGRSQAGGR